MRETGEDPAVIGREPGMVGGHLDRLVLASGAVIDGALALETAIDRDYGRTAFDRWSSSMSIN